jgi:membrane protein DedA with SNARE-associated domain
MSTFDVAGQLGYLAVPLATAAEGAGVPIPGETTLIAAALLAAEGHMAIVLVIALAAAGAAAGDSLGYLLGRRLGRAALLGRGPARRLRTRAVEAAGELFARYGGLAVFVGRFVGVGRIAVAWMAGAGRMPWRRFVVWNATACVIWATLVGGLAYVAGAAGARWIALAGIALAVATVARIAWPRRRRSTAAAGPR